MQALISSCNRRKNHHLLWLLNFQQYQFIGQNFKYNICVAYFGFHHTENLQIPRIFSYKCRVSKQGRGEAGVGTFFRDVGFTGNSILYLSLSRFSEQNKNITSKF